MWYEILRLRYWEEKNPGKRYSLLREAKNRHPDHKGKYTLKEVCTRTNTILTTVKTFESGIVQHPDIVKALVNDLEMTMEVFTNGHKAPVVPEPPKTQPLTSKPQILEVSKSTSIAPAALEIKSTLKGKCPIKSVVNHLHDHCYISFVPEADGTFVLHIYPDNAKYSKNAIFIEQMLERDGHDPVPRETKI